MNRWIARWTAVSLLAAGLLISGPVPAMAHFDVIDAQLPVNPAAVDAGTTAGLIARTLHLLIGGPAVPKPPPIGLPEPMPSMLPR